MTSIYKHIIKAKQNGDKLLAILLDPDKLQLSKVQETTQKINEKNVHYIFVGGSTVAKGVTEQCVKALKKHTNIPIVLFPGDYSQITNNADAILFLSLLSGRNPEYLIAQQIKSVPVLEKTNLEIIATGYILIDGDVKTATQKVSKTEPIAQTDTEQITHTAIAGMHIGNKLVYLEAGSGAKIPVAANIIKTVSEKLTIPIIVGGGIRNQQQLKSAYDNGADLVVIGTAFEENNQILNKIL